jgi:hypothetical protein
MISFGSGRVMISEKPYSKWDQSDRGPRMSFVVSRVMTYPGFTS